MTAASSKRMTFKEYVALEERSELRHEFEDGAVFAMAGGTPEHAALVAAVHLAVGGQLDGGCRAFVESLRVRTPSGKATYPDVVVICGPIARDPEDENTIGNPRLVIEVLSASTEAYDRGKKFAHYRSCPSFVEYVLVASQGPPKIERFIKNDGIWTLSNDAGPGEVQRLASVDVVLDVDAVYRGLVRADGSIHLP
ncbi:MAG: Uma2 family endonuclease [Labilithrix sp.]|nr:Uma2 family endonuclease [Labilithrix sp.]